MPRILSALVVVGLLLLNACAVQDPIDSFEDCVEAGYPVLESHPRQCVVDSQIFVEQLRDTTLVSCSEPRPEFCTQEYMPVCALKDNGVRCITTPCPSFDATPEPNACEACADAATMGYYQGACQEHAFVVCELTVTEFNVTQMAEDAGWICVDTCPGNYDEYVTQVGARMCIQHYGADDIEQWPVCDRSTVDCECVRAIETTRGDPVENPMYRCVPEQYAERLLFRSGQQRLDEEGNENVLIA